MVLNLWASVHMRRGPRYVSTEGAVTHEQSTSADTFDDDHFPAFTMGRATEMAGVTPAFLRALGEAGLIDPLRSEGGHRRYSKHQLRLAVRARELVDRGTGLDAACRIIDLEDQLEEALRRNEELRRRAAVPQTADDSDATA